MLRIFNNPQIQEPVGGAVIPPLVTVFKHLRFFSPKDSFSPQIRSTIKTPAKFRESCDAKMHSLSIKNRYIDYLLEHAKFKIVRIGVLA